MKGILYRIYQRMARYLIGCIFFAAFASVVRADEVSVRYAKNFEIADHGTHRILTVKNARRGSEEIYRYALVNKSGPQPELTLNTIIITTPVERVVPIETVTIGFLDALGLLESISGAASVEYITNTIVRERVASGEIKTIKTGQALDIEKLLLIQPDLVITSILGDPEFDLPPQLVRSGLPVVISADYMEQHPLARAEWIKFIATFYEKDALAEEFFSRVEKRYNELEALTEEIDERPQILCGAPYSSVWHVPGGNSYTARMISHAGGEYLWRDDSSQGGIPLDLERVFLKGANADFWINPSHYRSMVELTAADPRFKKFAPAKTDSIYNNTLQVIPGSGNPIWETGITRPDDVLADMIYIFHPTLLPEYEFVYYQHLE